ncbi:CbtA family protein [Microbacterium oleivorans]|uniref:CbtA family protein n=1 Tax=Microbacterium oleivorans TaxID=273677 RepID=A0A7D5ITZ7_9MICO|nr:CbtA family protein [Microbacterium oleivorans]QLD12777.1 CbtA family protein [Microbacterium oleivorans]
MSNESRTVISGAVAGIIGGLLAALLSMVVVEPHIESAIAYEQLRAGVEASLAGSGHDDALAADGHTHTHGEETEISRGLQSTGGVLLSVGLFGLAVGIIVGVAAYALGRLLPGLAVRWRSVAAAALTFVAGYAVPFAIFPTNPPAVGDPDTVLQRSAVYFGMVAISVIAMMIAVVGARSLARRLGWWYGSLASLVGYLAVVVIAGAVMPSYADLSGTSSETPGPLHDGDVMVLDGFPADALAGFRLSSLLVSFALYAMIGVLLPLVHTALARRAQVAPERREPALQVG